MTKRMLSLLLALVMTLSLCVPALAADDFAAEAVTEVEEQAPEAPEAPVAPEAEEPAEEPVVDEPAAEEAPEAVADEPEMASILPEDTEDLPYLVSLGVVSKEAHWELEKLMKKAAPYKEKADAGELYVQADYTAIDQKTSPAQSFLDAYENAQKCLDAIGGAIVDINVTTATIGEYMAALEAFLPNANGDYQLLTDSIKKTPDGTTDEMDVDDPLYGALNIGETYADTTTYPSGFAMYNYVYADGTGRRTYPSLKTDFAASSITGSTNFETEAMTMSYSSEYIAALKEAQTAVKAYMDKVADGTAVVGDYMAVRKTVLAVGDMEKAAAQPTETEGAALKTAITNAENIGKDKYNDVANAKYYVDWQHASESSVTDHGEGELFSGTGVTNSILGSAKGLQNDILGLNSLKSDVLRNDVNVAIRDLKDATAMVGRTFKYETQKAVDVQTFKVVVSIDEIGGAVGDGNVYGYAVKVGDYWLDFSQKKGVETKDFSDACIQTIPAKGAGDGGNTDVGTVKAWNTDKDINSSYKDKYVGKLISEIEVKPFNNIGVFNVSSAKTSFNKNDKVYIYFYQKNLNYASGVSAWGSSFASQQLTLPQDGYFGPTIKEVKVNGYGSLGKNDYTYDHSTTTGIKIDTLAEAYLVGYTDSPYDGVASYNTNPKNHSGDAPISVKVTLTDDASIISSLKDADGNASYPVWDIVLKDAKGNIIAQASEPVAGGWTGKEFILNVYGASLATADKGEGDITATGMTVALIGGTGAAKLAPLGGTKAITFNALSKWNYVPTINKILDEAAALVQTDYDKLSQPDPDLESQVGRPDITTVDKAFQTITKDITSIRTKINDATKANSKANRASVLKDLQELGGVYSYLHPKAVDMSALNALIQSIQYLKEDDYTYDSWGKMQDLIDPDGEVTKAMNADPLLQSTIDKATKTLQAAKDALVKEGEVDKTALQTAIANAKALVEADYTAESWAANKSAIDTAVTAAEAVVNNAQATQAQVNTALTNLNAAVAKLEKAIPDTPKGPQAPTTNNGTGWVLYEGTWYFFKNGKLVSNYWVGKIDGASQWDSNWYYVGADGKMLTGMQYLDDLHGGYGWYFLQPTDTNGEIGKMLTGYQWVGGQYGECYFSKVSGSSGKCTWSELLGNWNGTTWVK